MNSIGGLSNKGFLKMVQWLDTRRWSSGLKTKSFCFENSFHT